MRMGHGGPGAEVRFQPVAREEMIGTRVEPKICELCGKCFFRAQQERECPPCAARLEQQRESLARDALRWAKDEVRASARMTPEARKRRYNEYHRKYQRVYAARRKQLAAVDASTTIQ
ncbi:MAG: hypothetical protein ACYDC6_12410 [Acidobacteriaceae bacterium]